MVFPTTLDNRSCCDRFFQTVVVGVPGHRISLRLGHVAVRTPRWRSLASPIRVGTVEKANVNAAKAMSSFFVSFLPW
jgi:hypothetical protein